MWACDLCVSASQTALERNQQSAEACFASGLRAHFDFLRHWLRLGEGGVREKGTLSAVVCNISAVERPARLVFELCFLSRITNLNP